MADYACVYELTGTGTILFNNGQFGSGSTDDLYWIATIRGLDSPPIRAPVDDVPFGDGGLVHKFWKGPRHVVIEGTLIVQSVQPNACQAVFNQMEEDLYAVLESMLQTDGVLYWTPSGSTPLYLPVRYEVPLDIQPTNNYSTRSFNFGLVSEEPDPIPTT